MDGHALFSQAKAMPSEASIGYVTDVGAPSYYSCYTTPTGFIVLALDGVQAGKRWKLIPGPADLTIHLTRDGLFVPRLAKEE